MVKLNEFDKLIARAYEVIGKKLSPEARKKLKPSQFCGPGKSFPVSDCAHYTAALRLLNRSKFAESTKKKIHGCIMRKGKAMGCVKKEKSASGFSDADIESIISLDVFESTRLLVEQSEKNPGMELDFSKTVPCCEDKE